VSLYEPPTNAIVGTLLLLAGALAAARGLRRVRRALAQAGPLELVRGLRGCAVAMALAAGAAGVLAGRAGLLVLGAIFLGEELYETGILAVIIRSGSRHHDAGVAQQGIQPRRREDRRADV
jgi:hypothetical protein